MSPIKADFLNTRNIQHVMKKLFAIAVQYRISLPKPLIRQEVNNLGCLVAFLNLEMRNKVSLYKMEKFRLVGRLV